MKARMNKTAVALIAALSLTSTVALAEDAHHPDRPTAKAGAAPPDKEQKMNMMQGQMLKMHEQMHKIMDTKSPQERETLMREHRDIMHKHMESMGGMKDGGMMNKKPGPGGKGEAATQKGSAKPDAHQH